MDRSYCDNSVYPNNALPIVIIDLLIKSNHTPFEDKRTSKTKDFDDRSIVAVNSSHKAMSIIFNPSKRQKFEVHKGKGGTLKNDVNICKKVAGLKVFNNLAELLSITKASEAELEAKMAKMADLGKSQTVEDSFLHALVKQEILHKKIAGEIEQNRTWNMDHSEWNDYEKNFYYILDYISIYMQEVRKIVTSCLGFDVDPNHIIPPPVSTNPDPKDPTLRFYNTIIAKYQGERRRALNKDIKYKAEEVWRLWDENDTNPFIENPWKTLSSEDAWKLTAKIPALLVSSNEYFQEAFNILEKGTQILASQLTNYRDENNSWRKRNFGDSVSLSDRLSRSAKRLQVLTYLRPELFGYNTYLINNFKKLHDEESDRLKVILQNHDTEVDNKPKGMFTRLFSKSDGQDQATGQTGTQ